MKRLFVLFVIGLLGCNGVSRFTRPSQTSNNATLTISGFVSTVEVSNAATGMGSNSLVTIVTFLPPMSQNGPTVNATFCGNLVSDFVLNTFMTVNFTHNQGCSIVASITPTTVLTVAGVVSGVQVITTGMANNPVVTVVTFMPTTGGSTAVTFCGNVANSFLLNTFTTASFTQNQGCSTLVSILPF